MRHQLFLQNTAGLHEQASVDRLVRHLISLLPRIPPLQPAGDLFRRPMPPQFTRDQASQPSIACQLAPLGTPGARPSPSISTRRPVAITTPIALDLTAHRRRRSPQLPGDRARRLIHRKPPRYRLAINQRQGQPRTAPRRRPDPTPRRDMAINRRRRLAKRPTDRLQRLPMLPAIPKLRLLRRCKSTSYLSSHRNFLHLFPRLRCCVDPLRSPLQSGRDSGDELFSAFDPYETFREGICPAPHVCSWACRGNRG